MSEHLINLYTDFPFPAFCYLRRAWDISSFLSAGEIMVAILVVVCSWVEHNHTEALN